MRNNIIITGGELFNKGAQSMTFNVINRLKKIYPDKEIFLMSRDFYRSDDEKKIYNFNFIPTSTKAYVNLINGVNIFNNTKTSFETNKIKEILDNSCINVDLSGFRFSSQMGEMGSLTFLLERKLMNKYNVKQFIFPQSFGPFEYKHFWNFPIDYLAKKNLPKVEVIYGREEEAIKNIKKYTKNNVKRSWDSVFYSEEYEMDKIFKEHIKIKNFSIPENSVGVVPNNQLLQHNDDNRVIEMYSSLISKALELGNNVYIFRHSVEDLNFCELLKARFSENENVVLLKADLYCFELQELISKFKYLIGSRYHSIVHAYIKNTPALILGWAYKYEELANTFQQSQMVFDIRNNININEMEGALEKLEANNEIIREELERTLLKIKSEDIFIECFK